MKWLPHRQWIYFLAFLLLSAAQPAHDATGMDCEAPHPLMPPNGRYQGQCPVCGMSRSMWARTWITFDAFENVSQVCSFHCLADWIVKSGREPSSVRLAVYHRPEQAVPAGEAFIVVGSAAAGTMSPVSKVVFADASKARRFTQTCGGNVVGYRQALLAAKSSVAAENRMINARRLKKGKIVEPEENDRCTVCGMFPIRYPLGKCQIRTPDDQTAHFCSTQCLFAFLAKPQRYVDTPMDPLLIWVVDRPTGRWISARTAFYVIGSKKVFGPMGYEAFPFNTVQEAHEFAAANGGVTAVFDDVVIQKVVPGWQYPGQE